MAETLFNEMAIDGFFLELAEDDQWRKLERCVEVARAVWGE